jgi:hypothetical protein
MRNPQSVAEVLRAEDECPTCGSPAPHLHPAVQCEGEVETCPDAFHLTPTNQNSPEYIARVHAKRSLRTAADLEEKGNG